VYEGGFVDGKRDGAGVYTWSKEEGAPVPGAKYEGEYKAGLKSGTGVFKYPDGSKYTGQWLSDMRHGKGTYVYPNGDRYCGLWENDKKKGAGTYFYAESQTQYSGTFDDGVCTDGTWEYYDGSAFVCQYKGKDIVKFGDRVLA
jgi:antitoxin component YwqK of YwqJK toxin-antitoxin module